MHRRTNERFRRAVVLTVTSVLAASFAQAAVVPGVASAAGPSVTLPKIGATPVTEQPVRAPDGPDQATSSALQGNQPARGSLEGGGTPTATSLSPSATWQVSPHMGDFTWSYPMRVPPAPGGLHPDLTLSYRSSAVDGRTSATNNQPSWIGDGWSMWPGFVERTYGACVSDTEGDAKPQTGDLCWRSDNATAAYGGGGGMLIRNGNGDWRAKNDDGARIERFTGASNGDADGEHWKITTVDGTQYFFGSQGDAKSTWTVPVFGDDDGEPCHGATFAASSCNQPYRWNVDKVVDRNGNVIRYYYDTESNSYGMNMKDAAVSYIRGGTLTRIDYGLRDGVSTPSGRVLFTTADRCVPGSDCRPEMKNNWQDVPWEEKCDTATCKDHYSPTFWSTKRLARITTQVWRGESHVDVDRWDLDQQFPDPGDGEKAALWLKGITHTGLVGGMLTENPVTFQGTKFANRIVKADDGLAPLNRYRITGVTSETGGVITVNYASQCRDGGPMPATPQDNTMWCFPTRWAKKNYAERTDYFHKYVVSQVITSDRLASVSTAQVSAYEYLDGAAWHWDTSEFTKEDKKTWSEFRGFGRVRIRTGSANDPAGKVTMSEQRFYRGMNGDKLPSGTRSVSVSDSAGGSYTDSDWLRGFELESASFEREGPSNQPDPPRLSKTITEPSVQGPTATRGEYRAYIVRPGTVRGFTALASGGWRTTRSETSYDDRGLATKVNDLGDTSTADDDRCTTTEYDRKTDKWILSLPAHTATVSIPCGQTAAYPKDALAESRNTFDGNGNIKKAEVASERPAIGATYVSTGTADYDVYGRPTVTTDPDGNASRIAYTPALGGPVTRTVTTSPGTASLPEGLTSTTTLEPAWGSATATTDANDRVSETTYDALGRATEAWMPNRSRADYPEGSVKFSYQVSNTAPTVITTTKLGPNGNYVSTNTIYDPLLRPRQTQTPAFGGGRLITDTRYDSQGRVWKTTQPYYVSGNVDGKLWLAGDTAVPGLTRTEYDDAGRPVASVYQTGAIEAWRTTTEYGGDRVHVTPPSGGTTTTTINDARGKPVERRLYTTALRSSSFDATRYTHNKAGALEAVVDPAGNTWRFTYDLLGRQLTSEDPDRGTTTKTYDTLGRVSTVTDAAGSTVAYAYDALGRKTGTYADRVGGPTLTSLTYDTVPYGKGKLATATRMVGGKSYTSTVLNYNQLYQPTGTSLRIPPEDGLLAGTYTTYADYDEDGSLSSESFPAAGELPAESINYTYHDLGMPLSSSGGYDGETVELVSDVNYTKYGEPQRIQLGAGTKRAWLTYLYDTNNRRINRYIVDAEVPAPMQADINYSYNPAGTITAVADTPQAQPSNVDVQCFKHDYLQRITEAWTPAATTWSASTGCRENPTVAGLRGPSPYWHSYNFDNAGNRRGEVQHATGGDINRSYTYTVPGHAHALGSVTTKGPGIDTRDDYGYEITGETKTHTKAGSSKRYTWDKEGNLASVTEGGSVTSYIYGAGGNRLMRRDPGGTTLYLGNQELRVDSAGGNPTVTRYYSFGGQPIAIRQGDGGMKWMISDHQSTAQFAINTDSMQVTRRRQLPFGAPRGGVTASAAIWPGERGFVGGTVDSSTGLTHLGAREYDPNTGRFISVDPLLDMSSPQQMNGYAYADNSPISFSDPSGMLPPTCPDMDCKGKGNDFYNRPLPTSPPPAPAPLPGSTTRPVHYNPNAAKNGLYTNLPRPVPLAPAKLAPRDLQVWRAEIPNTTLQKKVCEPFIPKIFDNGPCGAATALVNEQRRVQAKITPPRQPKPKVEIHGPGDCHGVFNCAWEVGWRVNMATNPLTGAAQGIADLTGVDLSPEYVTLDLGAFAPTGPIGPGYTGSVTVTSFGQVSVAHGPAIGVPGPDVSLRQGWLSHRNAHKEEINGFHQGPEWVGSANAPVGPIGLSGGLLLSDHHKGTAGYETGISLPGDLGASIHRTNSTVIFPGF